MQSNRSTIELTFKIEQMELLMFEGEILTDDSGIVRRIKVKGDGYTNPNDGSRVEGKDIPFFTDNY